MRLTLELTDFQLAVMTRLLAGEDGDGGEDTAGRAASSLDELVASAIEFDAAHPVAERWREPRSRAARRRARPPESRLDAVLQAATGRALELRRGERLWIEQLVDGQCVDLSAYELGGARRAVGAARTRAQHGIHPTAGDALWTTPPEEPMLAIVADSAPSHDLCFPACTPYEYSQLTGIAGHRSCSEIMAGVLREWRARQGGDTIAPLDTGGVLNLWLPSEVTADGRLTSWPVACRRGDMLELEARMDLVVVLSACPDDLYGSSQYAPGPVRLIVSGQRDGPVRATRVRRTPVSATTRHQVSVTLPDALADHLDRVRAGGWLGTSRPAVARALLFRFYESTR